MTERLAVAMKQKRTSLAQLLHVLIAKTIQGARERRLISKADPTPGPRECVIRTQAGIDLAEGTTASQDTDQHIEQLTRHSVIDRFEWQLDRRQSWPHKVAAGQTVAQDTQRGKVGLGWHVHQSDRGAHRLPPQWQLPRFLSYRIRPRW
jgi:hypothetical protein